MDDNAVTPSAIGQEAIRSAIRAAGYGAAPLLDALEAECSPGGILWNDEHGYMNPSVALGLARLLARNPVQTTGAFAYTSMRVVSVAEGQDRDHGDQMPWKLKRHASQSTYDVIDPETGAIVGTVFHYLGSWWANNAGDLGNRRGTKNLAAKLAWEMRR